MKTDSRLNRIGVVLVFLDIRPGVSLESQSNIIKTEILSEREDETGKTSHLIHIPNRLNNLFVLPSPI